MRRLVDYHLYKIIYLAVCVVIVFCITAFFDNVKDDRKSVNTTDRQIAVFTVKTVPSYSGDYVTFAANPTEKTKIREMIYVRIEHAQNLDICIGDTLTALGSYNIPDKPLNPGAFDYKSFLESYGVSVCFDTDISHIQSIQKSTLAPIYTLRSKITSKIRKYISTDEEGIVTALVTGNKDYITEQTADDYRKSGIYHIVAVSGLHLNLFILFLSFAYSFVRLSGRKKALLSIFVTFFACAFMLVFTGFGISVTRAAFMALILCASGLFYREYSPFAGLFAVFAAILITEPYYCKSISFCLSFSATAGILAGAHFLKTHPIRNMRMKTVIESFVLTMSANIATIPFLVHYFGVVSLISPVSNIIVIMLCPFLLVFSYVFGAVCLFGGEMICSVLGNILSATAAVVNSIAHFFASVPFSYIRCSLTDIAVLYFAVICAVFFAKSKRKFVRILFASIFIVANISALVYNIFVDYTVVSFLNADQGDCSLIYDSDKTAVMIDCGSEGVNNFGEDDALPFLKHKNISHIDALFVTHFHTDHTNGVEELINSGYVRTLILPDRPLDTDEKESAHRIYKSAVQNGTEIVHVCAGDKIQMKNGWLFSVLNPEKTQYTSANEGSMVLRYEHDGSKILFCADIEELTQNKLLKKGDKYDIIKVAHHGGQSKLSEKFFDVFPCDYSVISCGKNNKYSHPHKNTLDALDQTEILRTDIAGAPLEFIIKNDKITKR